MPFDFSTRQLYVYLSSSPTAAKGVASEADEALLLLWAPVRLSRLGLISIFDLSWTSEVDTVFRRSCSGILGHGQRRFQLVE
jgi:hypothetical protein